MRKAKNKTDKHTDDENDRCRGEKKNTAPSLLRQCITFILAEEAFVSPKGPKRVELSGRERLGERERR